jgi:hypothetical protein
VQGSVLVATHFKRSAERDRRLSFSVAQSGAMAKPRTFFVSFHVEKKRNSLHFGRTLLRFVA